MYWGEGGGYWFSHYSPYTLLYQLQMSTDFFWLWCHDPVIKMASQGSPFVKVYVNVIPNYEHSTFLVRPTSPKTAKIM
jgi:hypothetical protein